MGAFRLETIFVGGIGDREDLAIGCGPLEVTANSDCFFLATFIDYLTGFFLFDSVARFRTVKCE